MANANNRRVSEDGVKITKNFEGLYLKAYKDVGGVWTIGWGCTRGVKRGQKITQKQAQKMLMDELADFEKAVNRMVTVPLTQTQFDALVSFSYNVGINALKRSTLLRLLNRGEFAAAEAQFKRWIHVKGKVYRGLVRRRAREAELFGTEAHETTSVKKDEAVSTSAPVASDAVIETKPSVDKPAKQMIKHSTTFRGALTQIMLGFSALFYVTTNPESYNVNYIIGGLVLAIALSGFIIYRRYRDMRERL